MQNIGWFCSAVNNDLISENDATYVSIKTKWQTINLEVINYDHKACPPLNQAPHPEVGH